VEIAGRKYEVFVSVEWDRYFRQLNAQTVSNAAATNASQAYTALLIDAAEAPDAFPGPPGAPGSQGDPGLPLFLLQDGQEAPDLVPGPPGPSGGQGDAGLALFMLQDIPDDQQILVPPASSFTTLTASAGFGCNGKAAQGSAAVNAAATDLATVIALCNQLRAALIANGIAA
jgi:hypothetical protein